MQTNHSSEFKPSFYAKYQVEGLTPAQIDRMLENGWARNDRWVYASSVKFMGDGWRSCVMLRLPVQGFAWKKKLRKLLRRNDGLFTHLVRPFVPTPDKEALWQLFKTQVHHWGIVPPLDLHVFREVQPSLFNTWELCVYHNGQLAAFSLFDLGEQSLSSLEAAYDPALARYSLGFYTLMLEIEHARQSGLAHYYPGFFPKDVPMFDYKLRPGGMEFFRLKTREWLPVEALEEEDWLAEVVEQKFESLRSALAAYHIKVATAHGLFLHRPGEGRVPKDFNLLALVASPTLRPGWSVLIAWDIDQEAYHVFLGNTIPSPHPVVAQANKAVRLFEVYDPVLLGSTDDPAAVLALFSKHLKESPIG